jgi:ABC-type uncharacterized transport system permease subunit
MLRHPEKEGLFQNFFWIFNFGHLFLSIFENPLRLFSNFFKQYILFLKQLKEPLSPFTIYIIFSLAYIYALQKKLKSI